METRSVKSAGPDHPIVITPDTTRVTVSLAGRIVADSRRSLTMREASYPPVHYMPRSDVDMALLERTDHRTWCPYKGECTYYDIHVGARRSVNAVWSYETPHSDVAAIKEHLAFYPDRVDAIEARDC